MGQKGTKSLAHGFADWSDDIVRDVVAKTIEHENAEQAACKVIQPPAIQQIILRPLLALRAAGSRTLNANHLAQGHCSTMSDLPIGIKDVHCKEFAHVFQRPP